MGFFEITKTEHNHINTSHNTEQRQTKKTHRRRENVCISKDIQATLSHCMRTLGTTVFRILDVVRLYYRQPSESSHGVSSPPGLSVRLFHQDCRPTLSRVKAILQAGFCFWKICQEEHVIFLFFKKLFNNIQRLCEITVMKTSAEVETVEISRPS